jgi:hypothetical protein
LSAQRQWKQGKIGTDLDIKPLISEWFKIDPQDLNRIELEDIRLSDEAETNLNTIISGMIDQAHPVSTTAGELLAQIDELIDCRGFWLESSRELLLYIQVLNQIKTILVPPRCWQVRHFATIH